MAYDSARIKLHSTEEHDLINIQKFNEKEADIVKRKQDLRRQIDEVKAMIYNSPLRESKPKPNSSKKSKSPLKTSTKSPEKISLKIVENQIFESASKIQQSEREKLAQELNNALKQKIQKREEYPIRLYKTKK